jgi:hypothetical protein
MCLDQLWRNVSSTCENSKHSTMSYVPSKCIYLHNRQYIETVNLFLNITVAMPLIN